MIYRFLPFLILFLFSFKSFDSSNKSDRDTDPKLLASNSKTSIESRCKSFYATLDKNHFTLPNFDVFLAAFQGFEHLKQQGQIVNNVLTVIDFSLSSKEERLWVIDMSCQQVLLQSLVAHGRNSGLEYATNFSNENESFKSSLGFFLTGEEYQGKQGTSLRLDGLEYGINHKARERAVVIHGANYVSKKIAQTQGYVGRSLGCPAVPNELNRQLIQLIKNKSCLFIYHPSQNYTTKSKLFS